MTGPELTTTIADDPVGANLASLNEIMTEVVAAVSPDPEFVDMVRGVLRTHSFALGYQFQGETRPKDGAS
jgi:hypothetical protein